MVLVAAQCAGKNVSRGGAEEKREGKGKEGLLLWDPCSVCWEECIKGRS